MRRIVAWIGGAGVLLALTGCIDEGVDPEKAYSARPLHAPGVRTVFVEMFTVHKKEFRREYEFRVTEALIKRIRSDTDLKIAPKGTADSMLSGEILEIDRNPLSEIGADVIRDVQITVRAAVRWVDLRTGDIIYETEDLRAACEYTPRLGEDEFRGTQTAVERLARRIVEKMEAPW
jgi:hypothetical protein